jgi:integrase
MTLTLLSEQNKIPPKSKEREGIDMSGGFIKPRGRKYFYVWYPWKGQKIWIRKYLDGSKIFHEGQARRVLEKIRAEVDQGIFDPSSWGKDKALLFQNAWDTYQEHSHVKQLRYKQREMIFQRYLIPFFKEKSIRDIRTIEIHNWFTEISKQGLQPSTLRLIKGTFRAFLWFHSDSLIKIPKFPPISVPKKNKPWLTEEEQERVFEFIPPQHYGILRFIKIYGCRPSEACNLKKPDVDWGKRTIMFRNRKANDENELPIIDEIADILRSPKKIEHLEYIFCTALGLKYRRQKPSDIWRQANLKAHQKYGIKMIALKNATRHSLASQLANRGESLSTIARILGNSEKVVENNYRTINVTRLLPVLGGKNLIITK